MITRIREADQKHKHLHILIVRNASRPGFDTVQDIFACALVMPCEALHTTRVTPVIRFRHTKATQKRSFYCNQFDKGSYQI